MISTPFSEYTQYISKRFICSGTLINRFTVLTEAACFRTEFDEQILGNSYNFIINYPFDVTRYSIYVGVHDISFLTKGSPPAYPAAKMEVNKIIIVRFRLFVNFHSIVH